MAAIDSGWDGCRELLNMLDVVIVDQVVPDKLYIFYAAT